MRIVTRIPDRNLVVETAGFLDGSLIQKIVILYPDSGRRVMSMPALHSKELHDALLHHSQEALDLLQVRFKQIRVIGKTINYFLLSLNFAFYALAVGQSFVIALGAVSLGELFAKKIFFSSINFILPMIIIFVVRRFFIIFLRKKIMSII